MTKGYKDKVSKKEFTLKILFLFFDPAKGIHSLSDHQVFLHILSFFMFVACLTVSPSHSFCFFLSLLGDSCPVLCAQNMKITHCILLHCGENNSLF